MANEPPKNTKVFFLRKEGPTSFFNSRFVEYIEMMNGWGFTAGRQGIPQRFEEQYHCYSVAYADKPHLEVRKVDKFVTFFVATIPGATHNE